MICPITFSDNGNIVQDKTAIRVLEKSAVLLILCFLISAVFLWTLLLLPAPHPAFLFSLILLPQGSCVLFFWVLLSLLFHIQAIFHSTRIGCNWKWRRGEVSFFLFRGGSEWGRLMRDQGFRLDGDCNCFSDMHLDPFATLSMGMPLLTCLGK